MIVNQHGVSKIFIGDVPGLKVYLGTLLVWQSNNKIKLDAPVISLSDSTISFEEIAGANSYVVYAGDTIIGEYAVSGYDYEQDGSVVTIYNASDSDIEFENGVVTLL